MEDTSSYKIRDVYQGVEKVSMGYRMLAAMGWHEGDGLGSNKQGIKTHIKAVKKFDNSGVGARENQARAQDWTLDMHNFTRVLSSLKEVTSEHAYADSSDDGASDDEAGAAAAVATKGKPGKNKGGSRAKNSAAEKAAQKNKREQQGKRTLSADEKGCSDADDGTGVGKSKTRSKRRSEVGSDDDAAVLRENKRKRQAAGAAEAPKTAPAAKRVKLATHAGRYSKREQNKMVRGYSATDLAAILGQSAPAPVLEEVTVHKEEPKPKRAAKKGRKRGPESGSDASDSTSTPPEAGTAATAASADAMEATRAAMARASRLAREAAVVVQAEERPEDATAWWRSLFQRAGVVGKAPTGSNHPKSKPPTGDEPGSIHVHGFSETDQTNLYHKAHDAASSGRRGLGKASQLKAVGGAKWQGSKKRFEQSDDEDDEDEALEPEAASPMPDDDDPNCDILPGGATIVWGSSVRPKWFVEHQALRNGASVAVAGAVEQLGASKQRNKATNGGAEAVQQVFTAALQKECRKACKKALRKCVGGKAKLAELLPKLLKAMKVEVQEGWLTVLEAYFAGRDDFKVKKGSVRLVKA